MTAILELDNLSKTFRAGHLAINHLSLTLEAGEFFCLLGPSGCGKSTLLRLIGGYLFPDAGSIRVSGADVTRLPPDVRQMGMVFQNYALFPHFTAAENVAFGLRVRRLPLNEIQARVVEVLDWVGLSRDQRERRPRELSGGEQQRVALARALVIRPQLLMLDEPFANLDRNLRERLREELRAIQRQARVTTILVTHDREEALVLADRVAVMQGGALMQVGSPRVVYEQPRTEFAATFIGPATLLTVRAIADDTIELSEGLHLHRTAWPQLVAGDVLCVRPENWRVGSSAETVPDRWTGTLVETTFTGPRTLASIRIGPESVVSIVLAPELRDEIGVGEAITVGLSASSVAVIRGPGHVSLAVPTS